MGRKFNKTYKKGSFHKYWPYSKGWKADLAKTSRKTLPNTPRNFEIWKKDTRKYDIIGIDTRPKSTLGVFKYRFRSKKRLGKKKGRENMHWRRYYKRTKRFKK